MMNKKGAVAIGIIVILTIGIYSFLFYKITTSSMNIKNSLNPALYSGHVYAIHEGLENSLYLIFLKVFLDSYQKVLVHNSRAIGFEDADLNGRFRAFEEYSMGLIIKDAKNIPESEQNNFTKLLVNDFFSIDFDGNYSTIFFSPWTSNMSFGGVSFVLAEYSSIVKTRIGFEMLELPSFDKIKNVHKTCSKGSTQDVENCLNKNLSNFNVLLKEEKESDDCLYNVVTFNLATKDKYYVLEKMQSINFDLIFNIDLTEDEKTECKRKKINLITIN